MKIEQQRKKLGSDGYTEVLDYQIEASSKAFEILFKNVYSDPIKAILRELATNAYDSHVEAGNKDRPFDIHLPTAINPLFYIRDYGVGLDAEELKNIYRVVFKSTKTNSNEQIGCFGLGCKTPFAYTDNYLIESFKNGKRYACNSFYNSTSKPSLAFTVDGEPTNEPNGLKVTIITKNNDYINWTNKAAEVYRYFTVKPNFIGNKVNIVPPEYIMSGNGWSLRKKDSYDKGICAIMGQIPYRVQINSVNGLSVKEISLANCGIDINFNIGELAVEANREGIHLNDRSCLSIKNKLNSIIGELFLQIESSIKKESCLWDASLRAKKIYASLYPLHDIISFDSFKYNNKKLISDVYLDDDILKNIEVYNLRFSRRKNISKYKTSRIPLSDIIIFLKDDKLAESRITEYIKTNNIDSYNNSFILLNELEIDPALNVTNTGIDDFCELLGLPRDRIIKVSTLPKPVRPKRTYTRSKTSKVNILSNGKWSEASVDLKRGSGYYVEMYQGYTICNTRINPKLRGVSPNNKRNVYLHDLTKLKMSMEAIGFPVYNIYGIRSSHVPKLGKGWKPFYNYAHSKLNYVLDVYSFKQTLKPKIPTYNVCNDDDCLHKLLSSVNKNTDFYKLNKLLQHDDYQKNIRDYVIYFCKFFGKEPNIKIISNQREIDTIFDKYYLLNKIRSYDISSSEEELFLKCAVDYINLLGDKK